MVKAPVAVGKPSSTGRQLLRGLCADAFRVGSESGLSTPPGNAVQFLEQGTLSSDVISKKQVKFYLKSSLHSTRLLPQKPTLSESPFHCSFIKTQQLNPHLLIAAPSADIHSSMNSSVSGWDS